MKALILSDFGREHLYIKETSVPQISENDVLIKVQFAGIGEWDQFEINGGYHEMLNIKPEFPYICGSEGAGEIIKKGKNVHHLSIGDLVYACSFLNEKGGFFAEYVAVNQDMIKRIPSHLSSAEASAISGVGTTALRGMMKLELGELDNIIVHGTSGGVGHLAVQLAKSITNNVFAVASGEDGVQLCESMGVNALNGKSNLGDVEFSQFNKMLFTTQLEDYRTHTENMLKPAVIAYPVGNYDVPESNDNQIEVIPYYGDLDKAIIEEFDYHVRNHKIRYNISKVFDIKDFNNAYNHLEKHYTGKLVFRV